MELDKPKHLTVVSKVQCAVKTPQLLSVPKNALNKSSGSTQQSFGLDLVLNF